MSIGSAEHLGLLDRWCLENRYPKDSHRIISKLNAKERLLFKRAKSTGYLLKLSNEPEIYDFWFNWCVWRNWPYLVVIARRKYADLCLDLITTDHDFSREAKETVRALFQLISWRRTVTASLIVRCEEFPIEMADSLAGALLNTVDIDRRSIRIKRSLRQ